MLVMGRVAAPFGIRGWVKIRTLTTHAGNLRNYPVWWLERDGEWRETAVTAAKVQRNFLVAQFAGVNEREAAASFKGRAIAVPREQLPRTADHEFYWADLIGLKIVNIERHEFGRVSRVLQTGANDVLVVDGTKRETLIPFIAAAILKVDLAAGVIEVDWGEDW
jgi:16S rRNA processing protein RimM